MDTSAVLAWLSVLGIFLGSIVLMVVLGYLMSSLFRWQQHRLEGKDHHEEEGE